ncbi:phage tail protein [Companilactobacillus farciminis]|nr:phage tail protein [Companilactobacillus farciminis]
MPYKVDFENIETTGLEESPVAKGLANLRANEARYFWNKYQHELVTMPADDVPEILNRIQTILKERDLDLPYKALEVSDFAANNVRWSQVYYDNGLEVSVIYSLDKNGRHSVSFKLVHGIDVPVELDKKFKFVHQRSQTADKIRSAYFVLQRNY